jgi:TM2 domain-containing membrane protein YozV
MKLFHKLSFLFIAAVTVVTLSSAIPAKPNPGKNSEVSSKIEAAYKDGKVTYSELKGIATTVKGSRLTLKERIALKVFGKKIASKGGSSDGKSQVIALILVALVGGLGIHRFYLGYTWQGIVQLLTLGGCGIWALIDLIRIITGSLQPKDGEYTTTL